MIDPINNPTNDNVEDVVRFPKTNRKVHEMSKPHAGMTLYCIDTRKTFVTVDDVMEAEYEHTTIPYKDLTNNPLPKVTGRLSKAAQLQLQQTVLRHKLIVNEHYYYTWAINKKNALKRWLKVRG